MLCCILAIFPTSRPNLAISKLCVEFLGIRKSNKIGRFFLFVHKPHLQSENFEENVKRMSETRTSINRRTQTTSNLTIAVEICRRSVQHSVSSNGLPASPFSIQNKYGSLSKGTFCLFAMNNHCHSSRPKRQQSHVFPHDAFTNLNRNYKFMLLRPRTTHLCKHILRVFNSRIHFSFDVLLPPWHMESNNSKPLFLLVYS